VISRSALLATAFTGASLVALSIAVAGPAGAATNRQVQMAANLSAADSGSTAVSYDPELAPLGARVSVAVVGGGEGRTLVTVDVRGLLPDRGYVASAHVNPCGATGADAGEVFRTTVDPAAENEVSLDVATDGNGAGQAEADVPFTLGTRAPRSVVLHADDADDAAGTGQAGTPAACITLPGR